MESNNNYNNIMHVENASENKNENTTNVIVVTQTVNQNIVSTNNSDYKEQTGMEEPPNKKFKASVISTEVLLSSNISNENTDISQTNNKNQINEIQ